MIDHMAGLSAFVHAAETRSFVMAGRQLGVSSSAIGKSVARLEEKIGVRLFHRSTRSIRLTPEGSLFLERCRRIFGEIEAAELELSQTLAAPRGKLRVSLPIVSMLMMPTLSAFMRAYPEVQLDLDFNDELVDIINEGVDAVIRTGEISDSRLMMRALGKYHLRLVASPAYLSRMGVPASPDALLQHHCLHHKFMTTGKLERWPFKADALNIELPESGISNSIEPLIFMAEQGLGIACLPDFGIRQQLADGRLQAVLDDYLDHDGMFRILWPSSRHLSPKLRVFVDFMCEHLFPETAPRPA